MCAVSNMGDIGGGMWPKPLINPYKPMIEPYFPGPAIPMPAALPPIQITSFPTKAQFESFLELLKAAMKFDEMTGQKECETAAKTAWIKTMCDHFGLPCPLK